MLKRGHLAQPTDNTTCDVSRQSVQTAAVKRQTQRIGLHADWPRNEKSRIWGTLIGQE